ncbi:MAG: sialate O-acetylesterase [bacterium]
MKRTNIKKTAKKIKGSLPGLGVGLLAAAGHFIKVAPLITGLSVLLWAFAGTASAETATPPAKDMELYLLIGQSNMAGRGKVDEESKQIHPRVFMLNKDGQWVPATDPLHFDKPSAGVGPGLAFGKALAEAAPEVRIGLIPCAVGGTSIKAWSPGYQDQGTKAYPYDDMLRRVRLALKDGSLKGIIWHQGESDRPATDWSRKQYTEKFKELIDRLRKDLDTGQVPFVAGELPELDDSIRERTQRFNELLHGLESTVACYACVSAKDLIDGGDKLHLDSKSARILGQRYAEVMLRLLKGRQVTPDSKGTEQTKDAPDSKQHINAVEGN